jgi:hypothetical protein
MIFNNPKDTHFTLQRIQECQERGRTGKVVRPILEEPNVIMQVKGLAEFPKTSILPSSTHASSESGPICLVSEMPPITRCRDIVFLLSSERNNKSHSSHQRGLKRQRNANSPAVAVQVAEQVPRLPSHFEPRHRRTARASGMRLFEKQICKTAIIYSGDVIGALPKVSTADFLTLRI